MCKYAHKEHLDGIAELSRELPNLVGVQVLPYQRMWREKLERFGLPSRIPASVMPPDRDTLVSWLRYLARKGVMQILHSMASQEVSREFPRLFRSI